MMRYTHVTNILTYPRGAAAAAESQCSNYIIDKYGYKQLLVIVYITVYM